MGRMAASAPMSLPSPSSPGDSPDPRKPGPFQKAFFWMAGARWEILRLCGSAEQERVAVIGSTLLVPTTMGFLGMLFFVRSRFEDPPFLSCAALAVLWALVILNTDRVLIALYRPFQPLWRRFIQVGFRLGLAGVVSLAITFPFCLDQYRPAIRFRYQTELQGTLNQLRDGESGGRKVLTQNLNQMRESTEADRRKLEADHTTLRDSLVAQLAPLERGVINAEIYADEKMEEERRRATADDFVAPATGATLNLIARMDAQKEESDRLRPLLEEQLKMHSRYVEAATREEEGLPNEFYPEPKRAGQGPRVKDLRSRDAQVMMEVRRLEGALEKAQRELALTTEAITRARLADRNGYLDTLASKREAFVKEAGERERVRQERLAQLAKQISTEDELHTARRAKQTAHVAALEEDLDRAQKRHDDTYLPQIKRLEGKINGIFDPMEETIGLYKVIFTPPPDMPEDAKLEYRWAAGVFQFLVVFGTLFLLDLIPIMVKLLSRPGPYDVLVAHDETTANLNWGDFEKHVAQHGSGWPGERSGDVAVAEALIRSHYRMPPEKSAAA